MAAGVRKWENRSTKTYEIGKSHIETYQITTKLALLREPPFCWLMPIVLEGVSRLLGKKLIQLWLLNTVVLTRQARCPH